MTANHALTDHPERYSSAPTNHPAIAQNIFMCHEDGTMVLDLSEHDRLHDRLDALEHRDEVIPSVSSTPLSSDTPSTKPIAKVTKVQE